MNTRQGYHGFASSLNFRLAIILCSFQGRYQSDPCERLCQRTIRRRTFPERKLNRLPLTPIHQSLPVDNCRLPDSCVRMH